MATSGFRADIQALRGWGVVLVVLYHANLVPVPAAYVGLDSFFVISGYLITGMVKKAIDEGRFRFPEFYFRRAKRLLPAAYVTFVATTVLAFFLLGDNEYRGFSHQVAGAVSFTANLVLLRQGGYFDPRADLEPLMHTWSLSIEEQYYLLLPAALVFLPRKLWIPAASVVLVASLAYFLEPSRVMGASTYLLLPSRSWEFALGSLAAMLSQQTWDGARTILDWTFWPSVAALLVVPFLPMGLSSPGMDTVIGSLATLLIIVGRNAAFTGNAGVHAFAWIGDLSYSLYLVHWPLMALMRNIYVSEPPYVVRLGVVLLAICLAIALYRGIELPIRNAAISPSRRIVTRGLAVSLIVGSLPFALAFARTPAEIVEARRPNYGFGLSCASPREFAPRRECRNAERPEILVWGDSYGMHLVPGLTATTRAGVMQATRSTCGGLVDVAPIDATRFTRPWAMECIRYNQGVLDYVVATDSIKVVVLSVAFNRYLGDSHENRFPLMLQATQGHTTEITLTDLALLDAAQRTVEKLRSAGKRVVIVAPAPSSGADIGRCYERKVLGQITLGAAPDCSISREDYRARYQRTLSLLDKLEHQAQVSVIRLDEAICSASSCPATQDGVLVYRDDSHLTYAGSELVARKLQLGELVRTSAR